MIIYSFYLLSKYIRVLKIEWEADEEHKNKVSINMDALKSCLIWPFVILFSYVRFLFACIFSSPFLIFTILKGKNPLSDFTGMFNSILKFPLGKYLFSGLISFYAPYTSSILPVVNELTSDTCVVTMRDWPWLRNP